MSHPSHNRVSRPFVCDCEVWMRSACNDLPKFKEHEGKTYCVLHYPGKDKVADFNKELKKKLAARDYDFRGVWFPDDVDFSNLTFTMPAYFSSATFSGNTYFGSSKFEKDVYFGGAKFCAEVYFNSTRFDATVEFYYTTFKDYVRFAGDGKDKVFGDKASLNLQFARIEQPDRFSFHTVTLRPHWFVNVDSRKFDITNVKWDSNIKQEIDSLKTKRVSPPHRLLGIACRNLALNAEESHRYSQASTFRYLAMDARRHQHRFGFEPWRLEWWYWLASGYGESIWRASLVFIAIGLGFAILYRLPPPVRCDHGNPDEQFCIGWDAPVEEKKSVLDFFLDPAANAPQKSPFNTFFGSAVYTLEVMTLQKPDPRPKSPPARLAVILCTIIGPLQAALLALAIRRKFMR